MSKKAPVKLSSVFASEVEQVELPDGRVVDVRPVDGIGFDLYSEMEADNSRGHLIWEIAARCLPSLPMADVKELTPAECAAVIAVALGKVREVQAWAEEVAGNAAAPVTTAEPGSQTSPTLSGSSVSASPERPAEPPAS